jgi:hypothetical protein
VLAAGGSFAARAATSRVAAPVDTGSVVAPPDEAGGIPRIPRTLAERAAASDLVFRGSVESVAVTLSEPSARAESARIPFTLVTYRVHDVIHGASPGSRLTLRFIGGLDPHSGLTLGSSMTPDFEPGDEDLLFVRDNTTSLCPLVGQLSGRLRVAEGRVFSDDGRALALDPDGALRPTRGRLADAVADDAVYADELAELIRVAAWSAPPRGRFTSARMSDVVHAPDMTPAPPPVDPAAPSARDRAAELARDRTLQEAERASIPERKDRR